MMRIILKILLFPVHVLLSLALLPCKFVCLFGTMMLSVISFFLFVIALVGMLLLGDIREGLNILFLAYLISPYGLPIIASGLIGLVDGINEKIARI